MKLLPSALFLFAALAVPLPGGAQSLSKLELEIKGHLQAQLKIGVRQSRRDFRHHGEAKKGFIYKYYDFNDYRERYAQRSSTAIRVRDIASIDVHSLTPGAYRGNDEGCRVIQVRLNCAYRNCAFTKSASRGRYTRRNFPKEWKRVGSPSLMYCHRDLPRARAAARAIARLAARYGRKVRIKVENGLGR